MPQINQQFVTWILQQAIRGIHRGTIIQEARYKGVLSKEVGAHIAEAKKQGLYSVTDMSDYQLGTYYQCDEYIEAVTSGWIGVETPPPFETEVLVRGEGRVALARLVSVTTSKTSVSLEWHEGSGYDSIWFTPSEWMYIPE